MKQLRVPAPLKGRSPGTQCPPQALVFSVLSQQAVLWTGSEDFRKQGLDAGRRSQGRLLQVAGSPLCRSIRPSTGARQPWSHEPSQDHSSVIMSRVFSRLWGVTDELGALLLGSAS